MLIEFSVENFRSIRTRQTLSMVATPRLGKKDNTVKVPVKGEPKFPALLKVAAIYGPNASGKSTVVRALDVLQNVCNRKPGDDQKFPVSPFRFDPELRDKPSVFEVHFIANSVRYSFEVALTAERIHFECLTVYERGIADVLYERTYKDGHEAYSFSDNLEGGEGARTTWKQVTGPQSLFVSQAVANSQEEFKQLRLPFAGLRRIMVHTDGLDRSAKVTREWLVEFPRFGSDLSTLLSEVDVPVTAIKSIANELPPPGINAMLRPRQTTTTTLTHHTSLGLADFNFDEESEGTKSLIGFALWWHVFQRENFSATPEVLVIDEFDSSLHPKLVEALVSRHIQSGVSRQLIFTTHDTHLMDSKLLRRDQIWLTERDQTGATQLRSVHDFEGREGEDIEKRYYEGRYRALPFIKPVALNGTSA